MTNRTDMWEHQVELLTKQCQRMTRKIDQTQNRLRYLEHVLTTLLLALKESGVIVDEDENTDGKTYEI